MMKKLILFALCCLALLANAYELKKITTPLKIDGRAEKLWQTAPILKLVKWRSNKAAPLMPSTVRFLYDDVNLYCLAEFTENNLNEALMQSVKYTRRDAPTYQNDCCELFLDPFMDGNRCFQFVVDVHGCEADLLHGDPKNYRDPAHWNGFWRSAVHYAEEMWSIEYAIPWQTIGIAPGKERQVAIDLSRSRRCNPPERSVIVDTRLLRTTPEFIRLTADPDPLPASGRLEHGALFTGRNQLQVIIRNDAPEVLHGTLTVSGNYTSGTPAFMEKSPVMLPVGKLLKQNVSFSVAQPGALNITAELALDKAGTVFIGSANANVQPPFDINDPHPMVLQGEKWGIYLRSFTPGAKNVESLIRQNGKLAAGKNHGSLQGKNFITLPTEKLLPGKYSLRIAVGNDHIDLPLTVIARP